MADRVPCQACPSKLGNRLCKLMNQVSPHEQYVDRNARAVSKVDAVVGHPRTRIRPCFFLHKPRLASDYPCLHLNISADKFCRARIGPNVD